MADRFASAGGSSFRKAKVVEEISIGDFTIGSEIGKGSFATVFRGRHQSSGAVVAVKSVDLAKMTKKLKDNLSCEIQILKKLRHPHIVALHDCVETRTNIYLVMEFCELGDLSLFIKRREKLVNHAATCDMARKYPSVPKAGLNEVIIRHFLKQLASALQFLRLNNFVHRDVKPQNLLLLASVPYRAANKNSAPILGASRDSLTPATGLQSLPMLKLADFGFARVLPSTSLAETLCGSPLYMAPEILRYERYDAKADLWSVGTVLYEMVNSKPPFRAVNHVELLRKIEQADDRIVFWEDAQASPELRSLIRALLKRSAVERLGFDSFFNHPAVTDPIPGLVEDDIPRSQRTLSKNARVASRTDEVPSSPRRTTTRRPFLSEPDAGRDETGPSSPRQRGPRSSPLASPAELGSQDQPILPNRRLTESPHDEYAAGLGIKRAQPVPSSSAPSRPSIQEDRRRRGTFNASPNKYSSDDRASPPASALKEYVGKAPIKSAAADERERAAQDIALERDYVVVEKKHVEVNAFADQLAAQGARTQGGGLRSGQIVRRATQQGTPTSVTGAVPAQPSRTMQIAQNSPRPEAQHDNSYDKSLPSSSHSGTSFITKAIQDASLRVFGFKYPTHLLRASPPQLYTGFPAYPTSSAPAGLISDGRQSGALDEEGRLAQYIEDYATRSDCVWGFAEVKYKQLVPVAPSMEHGLGGAAAEKLSAEEAEDGLTLEAVVVLSEEAFVLYLKALSLLAKSMDIASMWFTRKCKAPSDAFVDRVNSAVQWVRKRFNETLEKAEVARLKLIQAQGQLPLDHPSHPANAEHECSPDGVFLTIGLTAEKLMYERAVEMSRAAAINEIANEDLSGCEISYLTAIRMLEAVLDTDEDFNPKKVTGVSRTERDAAQDGPSEIDAHDQVQVQKMIHAVNGRLNSLRRKMHVIAHAAKAQQQGLVKKRSGDVTSRNNAT